MRETKKVWPLAKSETGKTPAATCVPSFLVNIWRSRSLSTMRPCDPLLSVCMKSTWSQSFLRL